MPAYFFSKKIFEKIYRNFQKPLDKMLFIWYNIYIKGRADNPKNRRRRKHHEEHLEEDLRI